MERDVTATIEIQKTLGRPVYEATIRKGPVVLWNETFRSEIIAYAMTKRNMEALSAQVAA